MQSSKLTQAKAAKNDEFYTLWVDIEREVQAYLEYDPNVFRGKTIFCPCDDPEWSNFTKFFALHFNEYGLKKLISTSFALESKGYKEGHQISFLEVNDPKFDESKTRTHGKIFVLCNENSGEKINIDNLKWEYMECDGDFRSAEVMKLRDEADIIVTNPPFSLFREFWAWVLDSKKQFLMIANKNSITYKEVFPCIKNNLVWSGVTEWSGGMWFETKNPDDVDKIVDGVNMKNVSSIFLTNIDHGRRHQPIPLMTMADNLKFSKHKEIRGKTAYDRYDNYDAIEVPYTDAIPSKYDGIMGVPITFLDKYCPEQFEILGITKTWDGGASKIYPPQIQVNANGNKSNKPVTKLNDGAALKLAEPPVGKTYYIVENEYFIQLYARVLIREKRA